MAVPVAVVVLITVVYVAIVAVVVVLVVMVVVAARKSAKYALFSHIWRMLGAKRTINTDEFGAEEAENHGAYRVFCQWQQKSRYLQ